MSRFDPLALYSLIDYLKLTDWTGRAIRDDKKGAIPSHIQPILSTLNINEENWLHSVKDFGQCFGRSVGPETIALCKQITQAN